MIATAADVSVDMRGKTITTFILYGAATKLRQLSEGDVLEIVADTFDPIETDIRAWCRMTGHDLMEVVREAGSQRFHIKKGASTDRAKKLALVISDQALEKLISPLGFALAAALAGIDVSIYFQGPGVRVLKKDFKEKLSGINRPFSAFARKGLADIGHIPPQDKLAQISELGGHFYVCGPSMDRFGVRREDLIFGDAIVSEYFTFLEVMTAADIHFFLQ